MREELEAEKKCIKLIQTGRTGSDETAPFKVMDFWAKTLVEFITEVLEERPHEWGFFKVKTIGGRVEYRDGELLNEIPDSWQYVEIESIDASGGWSRMDYLITPKRI